MKQENVDVDVGQYLRHSADKQVVVQEQVLGTSQVRRDATLEMIMAQIHDRNCNQPRHTDSATKLVVIQQQKREW